ncbi:hypothetical protein JD844_021163 [Phrynosoma platyrhinos]|uniref:Uncharacterized protein n=1 Tax=Phrynosoma platyrhinos TaxID=52577 RepID=A0ABQ7STC1_PHRPL|nr:hypothetical protein JD844_021163 [Phrynosoma platyrhinos]
MEEGGNIKNLAEQSLMNCNELKITSQKGQSSPSSASQRTPIELDSPLLPEVSIEDGILRELRAMRREMRLMKCEQRRTNARVVSVAHNLQELKEHLQ